MHFPDLTGAFVGKTGHYAGVVPDARGVLAKVRKDDGVHLCAAGVTRAAAIVTRWASRSMRAATWPSGTWHIDSRYHHVDEGCDSYLDGLPAVPVGGFPFEAAVRSGEIHPPMVG